MNIVRTAAAIVALSLAVVAAPVVRPQLGPAALAAAPGQHITIYIFGGSEGIKGPDGKPHDTFVPSSFVVKAGSPVSVTVVNLDESPHSMTAPGLGLTAMIKPGKEVGETIQPVTTTFTFTPSKPGVYRWYCITPCDKKHGYWAMTNGYGGPGQEGFMAGNIVVI